MQVRVPNFPGVNLTWGSILTRLGGYLWTRPDLELENSSESPASSRKDTQPLQGCPRIHSVPGVDKLTKSRKVHATLAIASPSNHEAIC